MCWYIYWPKKVITFSTAGNKINCIEFVGCAIYFNYYYIVIYQLISNNLTNFLGLKIDNLIFENPLISVCMQISSRIFLISRLSFFLAIYVIISILQIDTVWPRLRYAIIICGNSNLKCVKNVFILQQTALSAIINMKKDHCQENVILTLSSRIYYYMLSSYYFGIHDVSQTKFWRRDKITVLPFWKTKIN